MISSAINSEDICVFQLMNQTLQLSECRLQFLKSTDQISIWHYSYQFSNDFKKYNKF